MLVPAFAGSLHWEIQARNGQFFPSLHSPSSCVPISFHGLTSLCAPLSLTTSSVSLYGPPFLTMPTISLSHCHLISDWAHLFRTFSPISYFALHFLPCLSTYSPLSIPPIPCLFSLPPFLTVCLFLSMHLSLAVSPHVTKQF